MFLHIPTVAGFKSVEDHMNSRPSFNRQEFEVALREGFCPQNQSQEEAVCYLNLMIKPIEVFTRGGRNLAYMVYDK